MLPLADFTLPIYGSTLPLFFLARSAGTTKATVLSEMENCKELLASAIEETLTEEGTLSYTEPNRLCIGTYSKSVKAYAKKYQDRIELSIAIINCMEDLAGWKRSTVSRIDSKLFLESMTRHIPIGLAKHLNREMFLFKPNLQWYRFVPFVYALLTFIRASFYLLDKDLPKAFTTLEEIVALFAGLSKPKGGEDSKRIRDLIIMQKELPLVLYLMSNYKEVIAGTTLVTHWQDWGSDFGMNDVIKRVPGWFKETPHHKRILSIIKTYDSTKG